MKLTPTEIESIREAQDYSRKKKAANKEVNCPFFNNFTSGTCKLCFTWLDILDEYNPNDMLHPCQKLATVEILSRFWCNPRLHESV